MVSKLIPFYRQLEKSGEGYTLLLNKQSKQVYKVEHGQVNQYKFWITWAVVLALLRGIKDMHLSLDNSINILIVIILLAISAGIGIYKFKDVYKDKKEVYYTNDSIEYYIEKGRILLKSEIRTVAFIFGVFVIFMVLFFIYSWLTWLIFGLLCFGTFIYSLCGLPLERFKLYK